VRGHPVHISTTVPLCVCCRSRGAGPALTCDAGFVTAPMYNCYVELPRVLAGAARYDGPGWSEALSEGACLRPGCWSQLPGGALLRFTYAACLKYGHQGFVPLPGMVGYGATVWDPPPTHPARITEHGAPGGPTYPPPRITEHGAGNQRNYSGNQVR
jgi:hypothetical protein